MPCHSSRVRCNEAKDRTHGSGLPSSIRAQEAQHAAGRNREAATVEGDHLTICLSEAGNREHSVDKIAIARASQFEVA